MARQPRIVVPGQPLHIVQRGNNRSQIFHDESDFVMCYEMLKSASERFGCSIHAYVLMHNHYHLLATPFESDSASRMMQSVDLRYVRYFNSRYKRTGTLWEGRFRSSIIESERYFFTCSRYIELNPVRAGFATHPASFKWTSFHANATGIKDGLVVPHALFEGLSTREHERCARYQGLFRYHIEDRDLDALRKSLNQCEILGSPEFEEKMEKIACRPRRTNTHGGARLRRTGTCDLAQAA